MTTPESWKVVDIAVLVPCYNEEAAISSVVADFRAALPNATVYVFDNNSTDKTVEVARQAGAIVRTETLQGKGNVVRRMFADVEADSVQRIGAATRGGNRRSCPATASQRSSVGIATAQRHGAG